MTQDRLTQNSCVLRGSGHHELPGDWTYVISRDVSHFSSDNSCIVTFSCHHKFIVLVSVLMKNFFSIFSFFTLFFIAYRFLFFYILFYLFYIFHFNVL